VTLPALDYIAYDEVPTSDSVVEGASVYKCIVAHSTEIVITRWFKVDSLTKGRQDLEVGIIIMTVSFLFVATSIIIETP